MRRTLLSLCVFVACLLAVSSVQAQAKPAWEKICVDAKKPNTCRISQVLFLTKMVEGKQQTLGRILGLTIFYADDVKAKKRNPYISIQMPLGVDLRPGAVLRVDEGQEIRLPYLQCTGAGCDASLPLDSKLLKSFEAGKSIRVGFRAWGAEDVNVVEASLIGFTQAFNGIK